MPATESTWRDLKLTHVVFGVSSVAMLVTTVWMLAADHNRSWKQYQRSFRDIETWTAGAREEEQNSSDYQKAHEDLQVKLQAIQEAALSDKGRELFQQFIDLAKKNTDAEDSQERAADAEAAKFIEADVTALAGFTDAKERRQKRMDLYNRVRDFISRVRFREDNLAINTKFRKAALDKGTADYSLAVGKEAPPDQIASLQLDIDNVKKDVDQLTKLLQAEQTRRKDLEAIFRQITAEEDEAQKNLDKHTRDVEQLHKAFVERAPDYKKRLLELPILDAFNSPLKIDQIWLPNLTQNYNFRDVARFDRCNTCHMGINRTQPGSAVAAGYPAAQTITVSLATPKEPPQSKATAENAGDKAGAASTAANDVAEAYGFQLTDQGPLNNSDVTVSAVFPNSFAAEAGLVAGDAIKRIGDGAVYSLGQTLGYLLHNAPWGQPIELTVRRGMPAPYATHPRLDLFVGSMSPHPMEKFGCTICHQGQGSATSFEWASHTPSTPLQASEWKHEYGWFFNHHWIYPMYPKQFAESGCLKCHHEVVDLEPSAKFPQPPAPTLVRGYELVRNNGCFGCHEINGFAGPQKRVGPDLRTEPVTYAAAAQIKRDRSAFARLSEEVQGWVTRLVDHPEDDAVRRRLYEFVSTQAASGNSDISAEILKLEGLLKDTETPGSLRKVGPSLRFVGSKDTYEFLYSWIRNPRDFRPSTKMPRFFGLWNHLVPEEKLDANGQSVRDEHGHVVTEKSKGLEQAERLEPIEVRAIANYLLKESQHFDYIEPYGGITAAPSAERGKKLFETRGCLACHQHADFPQAKGTQGPDLSRIGAKLSLGRDGGKWLYSWLRQPSHYHARTVMPNTFLTPINEADGKVSDPAADVTVFLMGSTQNWRPQDVPAAGQLNSSERSALNELATQYLLEKVKNVTLTQQYLEGGIPPERASGIVGDERLLLAGGPEHDQTQRVLSYVGRRTIAKYGCSGCHDIPGFEDAKPIGTALADWGRKDPARLAFEQVGEYLTHHTWPKSGKGAAAKSQESGDKMRESAAAEENAAPEDMEFALEQLPGNTGWLMEKLLGHEREGFLWQKLHEPRSYDYRKTENKGYNERLRMPQFNFSEDEIEAIMTFVLGLVAEPPANQYVATYNNNPRQKAIIAGTKQVEQFNCTGCHQLDFQRWDVAFKPGDLGHPVKLFDDKGNPTDYPFELPHFTQSEVDASKKLDRRGMARAQLYGRPVVDAKGSDVTTDENEDGDPFPGGGVGVRFQLWHDTLIDGDPWLVGIKNPLVPENRVTAKYAGRGGDLPQWIYPAVVADELKANPNAKAEEAWGWLPPPLIGEGQKVQTRWLHDFLLDPYPIRPAVVLRMPKFNMNSTEASALVEFFAARDDAPTPYEFDARTSSDYLEAAELAHRNRLTDALKIVTNNNYCVKCHLIGEYNPPGSDRAKGPQLDRVHERMRPDYVHRWVGDPKRILPYTGMPVNIQFDKPVEQALFPGTSQQQLDGVVDLLMNWDRFAIQNLSMKQWIKAPPPAGNQPPPR